MSADIVNNETATCPFGDDIVVNKVTIFTEDALPSIQMTCEAADNYGLTTLNQSFCDDANFASNCCQYCKSKLKPDICTQKYTKVKVWV